MIRDCTPFLLPQHGPLPQVFLRTVYGSAALAPSRGVLCGHQVGFFCCSYVPFCLTCLVLCSVTETAEGVVGTLVLRSGFYPEFGADIATLQLEVLYESDSHLRVRITDPSNQRWEVPKVLQESRLQKEKKALNYKFEYTADPFDFRVVRLSDQEVIFDTNIFERLIVRRLFFFFFSVK